MDNFLLQNKKKSGARRIFGNAVSILTSDASNRLSTFIAYALIARYLGVLDFGQMALGFTFFRSFQLLSAAGLESLIVREVSKDHKKTPLFLVNASFVVLFASVLSIMFLRLITWILGYSPGTTSIIMILSLGLIPFSLSIVYDALFKAREKMHYVGFSNLFVNMVKIILLFLFLLKGANLYHVIILFLSTYFLAMVIKLFYLLRQINRVKERFNFKFCLTIAKSSTTFMGINGVNAAMNSFIVILLSKLTSEVEVGLYTAARQLMAPVELIFESIIVSVYPVICRSFQYGINKLKLISERVLEVQVSIVLPATIVLYFLADTLLVMLYGKKDFSQSAVVLQIIVWGLILKGIAKVFGVVLIASMKEQKTLRILIVDFLAMVIFGFIFISQYGLIGSAITLLLVGIVDFVQHYIPVLKMFSRLPLVRLTWIQIVAASGMVLCFILMHRYNPITQAIFASFIYISIMLVVMIISSGNINQLRARYLHLKSDNHI
jgi:O-antigen/teichoic acid export membrane protein